MTAPANPRPTLDPRPRQEVEGPRRPAGRRLATDQAFLWDLARALLAGHSWGEIARVLGERPRAYQQFYRPKVRSYLLRLIGEDGDPPHGTLARHARGCTAAAGRACDPCQAAHADAQARAKNRAPLRTDEAFLRRVAARLAAGESWEDIARSLRRTRRFVMEQLRERVQPYVLELVPARDDGRPHGHYATYVVGPCLGCEPCAYANWRYEREREQRRRRGLRPYVDAGEARAHVQELMEAGVGLKRISELSGVMAGTLSRLVYGRRAATPARVAELAARLAGEAFDVDPAEVLGRGRRTDVARTRALALTIARRASKHPLGELAPAFDRHPGSFAAAARAVDADDQLRLLARRLSWRLRDRVRGHPPSKTIRAATARKLLAVRCDQLADGQTIDALPTWALIAILEERGWTRVAIARALGQRGGGLQLGRQTVTVRTARLVRQLVEQYPGPAPAWARKQRRQPDDRGEAAA